MSTESPPPEPEHEPEDAEVSDEPAWPDPDPGAEDSIWFMRDTTGDADVAVRVSGGQVHKRGAPPGLFSRLVEKASAAITDVGNLSMPPLVIGAYSGASMTVVFGEVGGDIVQPQLMQRQVRHSAEVVAGLIEASDEDFVAAAYGVGRGAAAYAELVHLIESEGITLDWKTREAEVRRLDPQRAARQYEQLTRPPETRERPRRIEGLLYRAIMDRRGVGTAGIKQLRERDGRPGKSILVRYDSTDIENLILHEMLGRIVVVEVQVTEINPESRSIIKPDLPPPRIESIKISAQPMTPELFGEDF